MPKRKDSKQPAKPIGKPRGQSQPGYPSRRRNGPPQAAEELQRRAWEMRVKSYSFRQIAEELECSESAARKYVSRISKTVAAEWSEEAHQMRVEQTHGLQFDMEQSQKGFEATEDPAFLRAKLAARKQLGELWGLNAPTETKISGEVAAVVPGAFLTREQMKAEIDRLLSKKSKGEK